MEKIYESQESNKKKQKRHKQMKLSGSTCLSFSVALIAVFALLAVGISGISYAFPQPYEYSDSITAKAGTPDMYMGDNDTIWYRYATIGTENRPVFCIERYSTFTDNTAYTKDAEISDLGLYYLLSYVDSKDATWDIDTGVTISNTGTNGETISVDNIKYWAGQAAIYYYLRGTTGNIPSATQVSSEKLATYTTVTTDNNIEDVEESDLTNSKYFKAKTGTLFNSIKVEGKTITELISEANKKKTSGEDLVSVTITDTTKTITQDKNKKYYFSGPYTINVNTTATYLESIGDIRVTLNGAPDGTKLVDKDGKEVDANKVTTATEFYVRVPADKVTKATKITISVVAPVSYYTGYKYVASEKQTLAVLGPKSKEIPTGTEVELTPTGDTGMNVGQTVYFIGLIVLLCGVGIIYANAKPAQVKE